MFTPLMQIVATTLTTFEGISKWGGQGGSEVVRRGRSLARRGSPREVVVPLLLGKGNKTPTSKDKDSTLHIGHDKEVSFHLEYVFVAGMVFGGTGLGAMSIEF